MDRHPSLETRKKLSEGKMGQKNPQYGKPISQETKKKISLALIGKVHSKESLKKMGEAHKGKKNFNWKGGVTSKYKIIRKSAKYIQWQQAVLKRDNWTCQKCKKRGSKLHPHHILNFSQYIKLRFVLKNGITLCEQDHRNFHKIYGQTNNTQEQINEFLNG